MIIEKSPFYNKKIDLSKDNSEKLIEKNQATRISDKEDEFSYKTKEFKLYKNNINKILNDKKPNSKLKDPDDNNIKKQTEEDLLTEEKVFFDGIDSYDSDGSCDEIKNPQIQKNCLDSFL